MKQAYSKELEEAIRILYYQTNPSKYQTAVRLLEQAVAREEPDAFYVLARCYAWGDSGFADSKANDQKALELSKRGAELGSSLAILGADRFGRLEDVRPFMKVTHEQAFEEAIRMAETGNALAMYAVGLVYFWGDIVALSTYALPTLQENAVEGVKWFDRAAALGFIPAFKNAYISRRKGTNDVPVDTKAAVALVEKVQDVCDIPSVLFVNIGNDYEKVGRLDKMVEWYRKGVETGDATSMYNLGISYEKGQGVEQSNEMAANYYRMAKNAGFGPQAETALKRMISASGKKSFWETLFGNGKK